MSKKVKPAKASHTRLPKGHAAYNLPAPQGGAFDGAQLNSPVPMGAGPTLSPGRPMPDGEDQGGM